MTPSGMELATCRFVAQYLNHYATARPILVLQKGQIGETWELSTGQYLFENWGELDRKVLTLCSQR